MANSDLNLPDFDKLVRAYEMKKPMFEAVRTNFISNLESVEELRKHIHSIKSRLKKPKRLRDKLKRKWDDCEAAGKEWEMDEENLFLKINDLIGFRILHLYTSEFEAINKGIVGVCEENGYEISEGPIAKIWDYEYEAKFRAMGATTETNPRNYTSVHYVITSNTKTPITFELQVRTLMEEVWGEVDHSINYPHKTDSLPCREQIFALARVTSGATRLVDAIFASYEDHQKRSRS